MMTFVLASHVVVQSVDRERGHLRRKLRTATTVRDAPALDLSARRHSDQRLVLVGVTLRYVIIR